MKDFRFKKIYFLYLVILFVFIGISVFIGYHHEPWADEAHAWLIARDTSFYTLFFKYLHTDGHPALWHLILKLFQFCGLKYKYLFIIPVIFSSIGVFVFLFKSKFPLHIKVLFPFTYFIFYQYTIVARGYCLLFPILCCLAVLWDKRNERCFLFTFFLFLLINTEAYTYILAGFIYLYYIYDYIKLRKEKKDSRKLLGCLIFLTISFIVTFLYVYPISSNTFLAKGPSFFLSDSFVTPFKNVPLMIKKVASLLIILYLYVTYLKAKKFKEYFQLLIFILPVLCFYVFKYYNLWHLGIVLLIFLFVIWIQKLHNNKMVICFLSLVCVIQFYWSISSCTFDYYNTYSGAENVANFIKKYDYESLDIYGLSFGEGAINPYFDKNIFVNWDTEIGFFYWNTKNKFYSIPVDEEIMIKDKLDMVITSSFYRRLDDDVLRTHYNKYEFSGYTYGENFLYEDQTFIVYVLKEIDDNFR